MNIHPVFPIPVANFQLGREFTSEEMAFITEQPVVGNTGNKTSKNKYLLRHDTLANLNQFVQECVNKYVNEIYSPKEDVSFSITQSWTNYSKPGEWHHQHRHPNSFVSGVLYIKAANERDKIYFHRNEYTQIEVSPKTWNIYNSKTWWISVGTGNLLMFPSGLTHSVASVEIDERISLAFNVFPVGYLGDEDNITSLYLRN